MSAKSKPRARQSGFLTEKFEDELLLYDKSRHLACRLNQTAAVVWQNSNGKRTVADLVAVLRNEIGDLADEDLVMVTLDRLEEQGLIESGYSRRDADSVRLSRRRFIRRAGAVGAAALALPVVHGVVAPTPAQAAGSYDYTAISPATRQALERRYATMSPAERQALVKRFK
jgi:DNA-binding transcriptional ArsR family regulator